MVFLSIFYWSVIKAHTFWGIFFLQIHVLNSLQIIKITKHRSVRFVKRRTRSALDNFLGKSLMFVLDTMLWVSEGITQCLEPKAITTSEKHVQTSPISTEKSPEMAWVDKVKNININENYIYERFKQNISFNFEFCYSKRYTCKLLDGH